MPAEPPRLRVLLMQLPVPASPALNTPLAAGYLKAYAYAQGLEAVAQIEILPRTLADYAGDALLVEAITARQPDVLGLSLYTWNSERSLALAARVRERLPNLLVVAGGPEVQPDNRWLLEHPALDIAVLGEGEQTFAELLRLLANYRPETRDPRPETRDPRPETRDHGRHPSPRLRSPVSCLLSATPGLAFHANGRLVLTGARAALPDLATVPSPYLAGYLELPPAGMLMVEVSRWCPYSCSFCLYGRNMGPRLGRRYFGLERVLAEIAWGKARGLRKVHFVEANLNLVPIFWPLMQALAGLNADRQLTFYAELRGEHLTDEVVAALDRANVRYVEVGLQTANPAALKASLRRTDLGRWAAGTRRLYARGIEVFLDVILGLPADDAAGVAATLAFVERENLGPYDIFTLQVLPGTAVRAQATEHGLRFQERPPYYVLETNRLSYAELRRLRGELREHIGSAPDLVEGAPLPRRNALTRRDGAAPIDQIWLLQERADSGPPAPLRCDRPGQLPENPCGPGDDGGRRTMDDSQTRSIVHPPSSQRAANVQKAVLANQVDVVLEAEDLEDAAPLLAAAIAENPSTVFDVYVICGERPPAPAALARWRGGLPFTPGYLDRIAVYRRAEPGAGHDRLSPRLFLALPWTATVDPEHYEGIAAVVWRFELAPDEEPPLAAWRAAGGAGIWLTGALTPALRARTAAWEAETGRIVWGAA